ncbi:MAG: P-II family nitrogen regulator [bacterium]|nr:P-II family nitrogen regulator [bacterium]
MKMIRAIIRPEKEKDVVLALEGGGFAAVTKAHVFGRGKQKGLQVGPVRYDMLSKILLLMVVEDDQLEGVMNIISDSAKTGFIGDGKVFVSEVQEAYTVRTGDAGL